MMYLYETSLGRLDLGPVPNGQPAPACGADWATRDPNGNGIIVVAFTIGAPEVRAVTRNRALGSGTFDDSRFYGARAVSLTLALNTSRLDPQLALDRLGPYLAPRADLPRLHWTLPGSTMERSLLVRGVGAPVAVTRRNLHGVAAQWVGVLGVTESPAESTVLINPSTDTEVGRTYNLTFDRSYPFSLGVGDRIVRNDGNADAEWRATIFGPCTTPTLSINGVDLTFDRGAGLTLAAGESVTIDTRERTVLLNGDPNESRFGRLNFTDWSWPDVRLAPGDNLVRYEAASGPEGSVEFRWRSAWV